MKLDTQYGKIEGTPEEIAKFLKACSLVKKITPPVTNKIVTIRRKSKTKFTHKKCDNAHKEWTKKDDLLLKQLKTIGKTNKQIAKTMKRSKGSIQTRWYILNK